MFKLHVSRKGSGQCRHLSFPGGSAGKESACNAGDRVWSLGWEDPLEKGMATLQYSCLENSRDRGAWQATVHGIAQCWTRLKWPSMHACIGEGNGNPLQYSCLENSRDRGAWWAAVYGVAKSQTRLKQLSSSSSPSNFCNFSSKNKNLENLKELLFVTPIS